MDRDIYLSGRSQDLSGSKIDSHPCPRSSGHQPEHLPQCKVVGDRRPNSFHHPGKFNKNCASPSRQGYGNNGEQGLGAPSNNKPVAVVKPSVRTSPVKPRQYRHRQQVSTPNQRRHFVNDTQTRLGQMPSVVPSHIWRNRHSHMMNDVSSSLEPGEITSQESIVIDRMLERLTINDQHITDGNRTRRLHHFDSGRTATLPPIRVAPTTSRLPPIDRRDHARYLPGQSVFKSDDRHPVESIIVSAREFYQEYYQVLGSPRMSARERRRITKANGAIPTRNSQSRVQQIPSREMENNSSNAHGGNIKTSRYNHVLPSKTNNVGCRCNGSIDTSHKCPLKFDKEGQLILLTL